MTTLARDGLELRYEVRGESRPARGYRTANRGGAADPEAWAYLDSHFDTRAALTFYRELSKLREDALVADLPCPLLAFWGDEDEEIALGGGTQQLAAGLDRHGLRHVSFPGHDHQGMLDHLDDAVPAVLAWLDEHA